VFWARAVGGVGVCFKGFKGGEREAARGVVRPASPAKRGDVVSAGVRHFAERNSGEPGKEG